MPDARPPRDHDSLQRRFGRHCRLLRKARGLTQDQLRQASGLSADTIRRLEHGAFAASINTVHSLCIGLELSEAILWEGFELAEGDDSRALLRGSLQGATDRELAIVLSLVGPLLTALRRSGT